MDSDRDAGRSQGMGREKELEELFAAYVDRLNRGEKLDPDQILADHPGIGEELLECLEGYIDYPRAGGDGEPLGTLGDYTLRREIGRGGMGVVYDAWQNSMDRRVALKVLPAAVAADNKTYMRFMREARTAGQLNHPNIVPVHAMGVDQKTPYYAMEFVEGETLAEILDQAEETGAGATARISRLFVRTESERRAGGAPEAGAVAAASPTRAVAGKGAREGIEYASLASAFADVADGLHHAHSKGVIHRDIKPSNLILDRGSESGGRSHVCLRILDFGLARIEGQERLTASGEFLGTPLYVSPEQARARKIPIDHRTDIYSLGTTLYEVLTLRPPFKGKDHQDTLSQIISKDPSAPRALNAQVPRDLETIVLKCLRKDPQDRYGTAEALAQDLRRFARGEPIEAQPQPAWEKWARRFWRHRTVAIAAAAVALILIAGLATSSLLIWKEQRRTQAALEQVAAQRERADRNLEDARENFQKARRNLQKARDAVDEMLTQVGQSSLASTPGMEDVRRQLLEKALRFYEGFVAEEGDDLEVRREAGRAQLRMGDILSLLGRHAESEKAYGEAIARSTALAAERPDEPTHRHDLARAHAGLADLLEVTGRHEEAKKSAGDSRDILAALSQRSPEEKAYREDLASAEQRVGKLLWNEGKHDEATSAYRRAIEIRSALLEESPSSTPCLLAQAANLADLSLILRETGAFRESGEMLARARELAGKVEGEAKESLECLLLVVRIREQGGSEEDLREALVVKKRLAQDFPRVPGYRKGLAGTWFRLAAALQETSRRAETEEAFGECLGLLRKLAEEFPGVPDYKERLAWTCINHANWLRNIGKATEGIAACREAVRLSEELARDQPEDPSHFKDLAMNRSNLAAALMLQGDAAEAEKEFLAAREVLRKLRADHPQVREYPVDLAMLNVNLGHVLRHQKRLDEAEEALREAVGILQTEVEGEQPYAEPRIVVKAHINLAEVLAEAGRTAQAEESLARALSMQDRAVREAPDSLDCREELAVVLETTIDVRLASGRLREAVEIWPRALDARGWLAERDPRNVSHPLRLGMYGDGMARAFEKLGEAKSAEEERRRAEESYRKALALAPENGQVLDRLAQLLISGLGPGQAHPAAAEAARLAGKAVEVAPETGEFWRTLGVASFRSGDWKKSVEALGKAMELGPEGGPGEWFLLAMACWQLAEKAEAVKWHEKALDSIDEGGGGVPMEVFRLREEAEGVLGLRELEAQRYMDSKTWDVEKAEEALRDVVRFWEKLVEEAPGEKARSRHLRYAYSNLGQILKLTGRPGDAEEVYRKALALAPDDPTSLVLLSLLLAARPEQPQEKVAEAVRLAAKAAKASPENATAWRAVGLACYRSGRWAQAAAALERSMKLSKGGGPREWLFLAMARWKLGEKEEARKWYDQAVARLEEEKEGGGISKEMQAFREEAEALLGAEGSMR